MKSKGKKLWDLPTRIVHWGIAAGVVVNLWVFEEGSDLHDWVGYAAAGLVGIRISWGLVGSAPSRFVNFPLSLRCQSQFLTAALQGKRSKYLGHNPPASLSYLLVWGLVLAMAVTGWMMSLDRFWGEEWLEETHEILANGFIAFMLIHAAGIFIDAFQHRRKTWMGMITGKRS